MSYILEALKKSESERQQAKSPPSIHSPNPSLLAEQAGDTGNSRLVLWVALVVILFLALLAAGYSIYGNKMISITITVPEENNDQKGLNTAENLEIDPVPADKPSSPESIPVIEPDNTKNVIADISGGEMGKSTPAGDEPWRAESDTVRASPEVPHLKELDTAFQNTVPELKLAGHAYSEDAGLRMILINNRVVREKGAAAQGIILEEITQDGIILRKGNIRFRLDIP